MAKAQRKIEKRLKDRRSGNQNWAGVKAPLQFGVVDYMGARFMFHVPGSQNRNK